MDMYQKRKKRQEMKNNENKKEIQNKTNINWYPGHMAKTKRLIKENINLIDIIYEVIDARVPFSSKIVDINEVIGNKKRILVMTKYDLCDKSETDKFIKYYEDNGYYVYKCDLIVDKNVNKLFDLTKQVLKEDIEKINNKGIRKDTIRVLVVGIPNVGKSTLINKIVGMKKAVVGNKPGVTKNLSWIRVKDGIELMDSPGILWPKLEQEKVAYNLAATTAIKEEILEKSDVVIYIIKLLYKYYPKLLKEYYDVSNIDDFLDVFNIIGKKKGFLIKGGEIDYDRVIDLIINDVKTGKLKGITFDRIKDLNE